MHSQAEAHAARLQAAGRPTRTRFKVLAFASSLAALTYLDRVCIATAAPAIMRDFGLTPVEMGFVFSAFTVAYGLFEIPTGAWGDRIGARKVITRIVAWWSAFTMLTAATFNFVSLLAVRFLFGIGEAGAWPNSARALSRWFPASERGTAQGIFFMGAHLAGGLTPLLVAAMMAAMSWRWVFLIFGAFGFVWAAAWFRWFRDEPSAHPSVNSEEARWIEAGRPADTSHALHGVPWKRILTNRGVWGLCGMYFTQGYGFYFYITWLPTYLERERGLTAMSLGLFAGLPLLLSVAADLLGGLTTDFLTRRFGVRVGRTSVGIASLVLASVFMLAGTAAPGAVLAATLIALAGAWSNFLLGAAWGAVVEIGGSHAGVVSAIMNTAGQVGGVLSPIVVALLVDRLHAWEAPLYVTGVLYFLGALCWLLVDPRRTVAASQNAEATS